MHLFTKNIQPQQQYPSAVIAAVQQDDSMIESDTLLVVVFWVCWPVWSFWFSSIASAGVVIMRVNVSSIEYIFIKVLSIRMVTMSM